MSVIRKATPIDIGRIAEIEIFNYRLNFYPIFRNDDFYFGELQVPALMQQYDDAPLLLEQTYVYDDGVVKGFVRIGGCKVEKLFVEPVLQGQGIGAKLMEFAVSEHQVDHLWALEKNERAIAFYARHGFITTGERQMEEDTDEFLIRLARKQK